MKKTIKSLLAIAITAFAFTACSDVPAPYDMPGTGGGSGGGEIAGATGTGQLTDPYNCVAAINTGGTTDWVFIKGKICEIKDEYTTQYGNGTFYISDDGTKTNKFYVYRAYYLGNKKFTSSDTQPKVGDDVIICGIITNYNGTIETTQNKGFIYELNGENRGGDPTGGGTGGEQKGTGTEADPFNVAAAVAKCKATGETATTESYYIKGIAESEYTVDSYKNVTVNILDSEGASEKFTVYRVKDKDGKGIKQGYKIEKGATLIVYGPVVNFKGNTPETATGAYLVSVNGQAPEVDDGSGSGGTTPSGDTDGTEAKPYTVTDAIAAGSGTNVFVKAYIVGWIDGKTLAEGAKFNGEATAATNIIIAASADETDLSKCMPVQLPTGAVRSAVNLQDNPGNYKKEILLVGNIEKYFGATGLKSVSYAKIGDTEAGTKPSSGGDDTGGEGGGSSNTGTLENPLTASQVYDIVAAMEKGVTSTEDYYVKGKICSIKFTYTADYGTATFNITDDGNTGSKEFTAYSTYYHASEQKWKDGDTQVAVGDEVVICGKVVNYNGNTPEFASKKSYVVTINGN